MSVCGSRLKHLEQRISQEPDPSHVDQECCGQSYPWICRQPCLCVRPNRRLEVRLRGLWVSLRPSKICKITTRRDAGSPAAGTNNVAVCCSSMTVILTVE